MLRLYRFSWIINESVKTEGCNESGRMDVFFCGSGGIAMRW